MAGRNMNRGKATPPYEWRHGWIPLTPGAALMKAKGSARAATRLKAKHSITAASSRPDSPARNAGTKTRTVGRPADIPTPDTTVAASSRRAAIGRMSDAQLADLAGRASNRQTQRFAADEIAKRGAKVRPDTSGVPLPDGYKLEQNRLSDGRPGGYNLIRPDGTSTFAGMKQTEAARKARADLVVRQRQDAELQARRDEIAGKAAAERERSAVFRAQMAKPTTRSTPEDIADYRDRQQLRDRNRYQRVNGGQTQLSGEQLEKILADPDASTTDKKLARDDLAAVGYQEARTRLASVDTANLPEALARIEASDWPQWRKDGARKVISERLGSDRPAVEVVRSHKVAPDKVKPGDTYVSGGNNGRGAGFAGKVDRVERQTNGNYRIHFTGGNAITVESGRDVTVQRPVPGAVAKIPRRTKADTVREARERYGNGSPQHLAALVKAQGRKRR